VRFSQDVEVKEFFEDQDEVEDVELSSRQDESKTHKIKLKDLEEEEEEESILHKRTFSESVGGKFKD
jgi:hypothetical protein